MGEDAGPGAALFRVSADPYQRGLLPLNASAVLHGKQSLSSGRTTRAGATIERAGKTDRAGAGH